MKTVSLRTGNTKTCSHKYGTCTENFQNRKVFKNNTSGVPGVEWLPNNMRWKALICFRGKRYYLGAYQNFEDAVKARRRAEENLYDNFLNELAGAQVRDTGG